MIGGKWAHRASLLQTIYTTHCDGSQGAGVEQVLPVDRTRFYAYGRQALAEALRGSGVGPGDRVLLPGLICREVLVSVSAVRAVPLFYAVDEALTADADSLRRAGASGARAVLAVNYFGFPQPLDAFRAYCRQWGAALIEDNAHGFLSAEGQVLLGHRGDLGIFSLRKTLSLPNGAAVVDNRDEPCVASLAADGVSPWAAELRYHMKAALKRLLDIGGLPMARVMRQALRCAARGVRAAATAHDLPPMPRERMSAMTVRLLSRCDGAWERDRRRTLYQQVQELLVPSGARPVFPRLPPGVTPYAYPFYAPEERLPAIRRFLERQGLMATSWPELPPDVVPSAPCHYKTLRCVRFLW